MLRYISDVYKLFMLTVLCNFVFSFTYDYLQVSNSCILGHRADFLTSYICCILSVSKVGYGLFSLIRFGWFIPNRTAVQFPPTLNHWKVFTMMEQSKLFKPSPEYMNHIEKFLQGAENKRVILKPKYQITYN